MESEMDMLNQALALTSTEDTVRVAPDSVWTTNNNQKGFVIVGRILTKRSYRFDAFKTTMTGAFNPIKEMVIQKVTGGRFLITLSHAYDFNRIMKGGPWSFEKNLLILKEVGELDDPISCPLNCCVFHAHLSGIPFTQRTRNMVEYVGNQIGKFVDFDEKKRGVVSFTSSMRIQVKINMEEPLKRVVKIGNQRGVYHKCNL